jgi:hypothetical protein
MSCSNLYAFSNSSSEDSNTQIQRVRIDITTTMGYTRHLLLGFTPDNAATDGVDYGYDAQNIDNFPNDCNWIIEDERYVIQGVGAFDVSKTYPLGLFLTDAGSVEFSLQTLENFDEEIDVFVYDALDNSVVSITEFSHAEFISEGNHTNRFFITFTEVISEMNFNSDVLSLYDQDVSHLEIKFYQIWNEVEIQNFNSISIERITLYDLRGKLIQQWNSSPYNSVQNERIYLGNVSKGNYIISVKANGSYHNKQIAIFK